jgi:DNA-binding MarR family transcriptional regulator
MSLQEDTKPKAHRKQKLLVKSLQNGSLAHSALLARGAGFEHQVELGPKSSRVYDFLVSKGVACLRDVVEGLGESSSVVGDALKRLWRRGLILRSRDTRFVYELNRKGRGGATGHIRAVNYYVVNDGREIAGDFVRYEDRKKDGRDKGVESKASRVLNFLRSNVEKAFYSVDIMQELKVKRCDIMANVRRFERK